MTVPGTKPSPPIKPRDRDTVINALRAGVVPRLGLQHIQVGRRREIEALIADVARVADGGAAIRFVVGEYGAGKTFFLFLVRQLALAKNLVVLQADLAPDRRIHATGGQARLLYAELVRNLATRTAPDGERCVTSSSASSPRLSSRRGAKAAGPRPGSARSSSTCRSRSGGTTSRPWWRPMPAPTRRVTRPGRETPCVGCAASTRRRRKRARISASAASSTMPTSTTA